MLHMQVWAYNQCGPNVGVNTNIVTPACTAGGAFGAVCVQQCAPGLVPVSGSQTSTCMGEYWDTVPLICELPCTGFPVPLNVATVRTTIMAENFDDPIAEIQGRWFPMDHRQEFGWVLYLPVYVCADEPHTVHVNTYTHSVHAYAVEPHILFSHLCI